MTRALSITIDKIIKGEETIHFLPNQDPDFHKVYDSYRFITNKGVEFEMEMYYGEILSISDADRTLEAKLIDPQDLNALLECVIASQISP